jgi:dTMP kinase
LRRGAYVTVEGIDGAGKSTLVEGLAERCPNEALAPAEPDESLWTGRAVREALSEESSAVTDTMLFLADRAEHLRRTVEPALRAGTDVISDRGADSTYAYQAPRLADELGLARADAVAWLDELYAPWDLEPAATVWLDASPSVAADRMDGAEKWNDEAHLRRTRDRYEAIADANPGRFVRIDGDLPPEEAADAAAEAVWG